MNPTLRALVTVAATALALVALPASAGHHDPKFFPPPTVGDMKLPFSEAVQVGPFLFLSGQIGNKPGTAELVPGGIQAETRATLEKIKATVENHGSSMDRVAKCTVFLADMAEWAAMNEVYVQFFPNNRPARSAFASSGLALGARVEIECIAVVAEM
jgi:2-iminobutanoate/2-iminopropanoate deaminase